MVFRLELLQRINDPVHSRDFTQHTVSRYQILKLFQRIIITELIVKIIPNRRGNNKIIGNPVLFGTMFTAAARLLLRSPFLCGPSRVI